MHLLLTDQLACPYCGPAYGLILLADRVEARRVHEGRLGCANCERKYAVEQGIADFGRDDSGDPPARVSIDPMRMAALLGVAEGPANVLLIGGFDDAAAAIAEFVPDVELIVANAAPASTAERMGVSKLRVAGALPLHNSGMRGVAIDGALTGLIAEAARVCALAARLVVVGANAEARRALEQTGLYVAVDEADTIVAVRQS